MTPTLADELREFLEIDPDDWPPITVEGRDDRMETIWPELVRAYRATVLQQREEKLTAQQT